MKKKKIMIVFVAIIGVILIALGSGYLYFSAPVDRGSLEKIEVVVPSGSTTRDIARILKDNNLIRNELFFKGFAKMHGHNSLKASTYVMSRNMSLSTIMKILTEGNTFDPNAITITFREGQNIPQYAATIMKHTNHTSEEVIEVMNDKEFLAELINTYWFLTDEILNPNIYFPLEGYLAPNTYQFRDKDVSVQDIVTTLLNQMKIKLDPLKEDFEKSTHTVHEVITMASIVALEAKSLEYRKLISGVLYHRLEVGMALGMDPTAYYAHQVPMTRDLTREEFNTYNPYNTRGPNMEGRLPVGPICNPDIEAIEAALNPTETTYLFFVADRHGVIHFTHTYAEHNKKIQEIRDKGDWIW